MNAITEWPVMCFGDGDERLMGRVGQTEVVMDGTHSGTSGKGPETISGPKNQ